MEKKASEVTIGTIIFIILGLIVLVILIYGFSTGWTNLWEKITGITGGEENVQTIVQSCEIACATQSMYDYCTKVRTIRFKESEISYTITGTCNDLEEKKEMDTNKIDAATNLAIKKFLPTTELSCDLDCPLS